MRALLWRILVACAAGLSGVVIAWAHPMDVPFHDWFVTQMRAPEADAPGSCCGDTNGDARYVDVRSLPNGHYEVLMPETGTWVLYPLPVNPNYPNPTGQNVLWYSAYSRGSGANTVWEFNFFCLRLAQGT